MRRRLATIALLAATVAPLGACDQLSRVFTGVEYSVTSSADALSGRKVLDRPRRFAVAGAMGVDVESFGGSVEIDVDEDLENLEVIVTRRAVHGFGRREEADASLEQIDYTVEIVPGDLGQVLQVRATTTHAEPYFQRVDVVIRAPEIEGVRVRTQNGDVTARRIRGQVDIVTSDGDVRVMTPYPMHEKVTVLNNAGDIDFRVRGESAGMIDGESIRGTVQHRVERGAFVVHPETGFNRLKATLNDGENSFTFRTVDGNVRIAVVTAPTKAGRMIFD